MASLFENMPGVAANAVNSVKKALPSGDTGNLILYILFALVIVLIYLLLTGYKLSFKMLDIRPKKYKALGDAHWFWKNGMGGASNLRLTDADGLPLDTDTKYTYHFDLLLSNTRNVSNIAGPYHHIFHRGSDELYNDKSAGVMSSDSSSKLPPYGLPRRLNPGIFLDPNTNDILVFVDTKSKSGEVFRESGRISDVPVDKPLRLTVTVHNKVLEIDLNCKLELTKVLAGDPRTVENVVYGLCGPAVATASIQNLLIWPYALDNGLLADFCPMPFPQFLPPASSCDVPKDPALKDSAPN